MTEQPTLTGSPKSGAVTISTMATSVYDRIRADIVAGVLSPGKKLRTESLRKDYETGNSPIREALNRLSSDGFVVREEQRGFHVAKVSRKGLLELVKTRCWLEDIALRESIKNGGVVWEEQLVLAAHRLSRTPRFLDKDGNEPNPDWGSVHQSFHMALISACDSQWLLNFCAQLHDQSDRYRQLAVATSFPKRDPKDEHEAIFNAAIDGRADEAVALLKKHYEKTAAIIQSSNMEFDD